MIPRFYTIPTQQEMAEHTVRTPDWMYPSKTPTALVWEGGLDPKIREKLIAAFVMAPEHHFPGCKAVTKQRAPLYDQIFAPIVRTVLDANRDFFGFDLTNVSVGAFLQTYTKGGSYAKHTDAAPGQSRKLTAVILLSDPEEYDGGILQLLTPTYNIISRTQGTVVIFPSWILHEVSPVERGIRQSINLGFWGPPFR